MDANHMIGTGLLLAGVPALAAALFLRSRMSAAVFDLLRGAGGLFVVAGGALVGGIVRWV